MNHSLINNNIKQDEGVYLLANSGSLNEFEKDYLNVREKEGRIFPDKVVRALPFLPISHPLKNEWLHRAVTQQRFNRYLLKRKNVESILDLGCGNGWFTANLNLVLPEANILGLDVNITELRQARSVFTSSQLSFAHGDIFADNFVLHSFDMIILNASIQYFPDLKLLVNRLLELLKVGGEIHILDSRFYKTEQQKLAAKKRSEDYFSGIQEMQMAQYYYHHTFSALQDYTFVMLYKPTSFQRMLSHLTGRKISLFPWIRISKS
jgi:ubiquinone/menaquinone biosynthesis C-methylase UbiE